MNKNKFLSTCLILFTSLIFTSCSTDVEPLDPAVVVEPPGGGNNNDGETTGDYWPMAVNNQWAFAANGTNEAPMKIVSTEQINGTTYYKYENFLGTSIAGTGFEATVWTRKSGGTYYARQQASSNGGEGVPSITVEPFEIIILKDHLAVNGTWEQSINQTTIISGFPPMVTVVNIQGKVLEKDVALTVNGEEFPNVIKVQVIQNTQGVTNTNYYWFAEDVGIIKYQNIYQAFVTTHEIVSYTIN